MVDLPPPVEDLPSVGIPFISSWLEDNIEPNLSSTLSGSGEVAEMDAFRSVRARIIAAFT